MHSEMRNIHEGWRPSWPSLSAWEAPRPWSNR